MELYKGLPLMSLIDLGAHLPKERQSRRKEEVEGHFHMSFDKIRQVQRQLRKKLFYIGGLYNAPQINEHETHHLLSGAVECVDVIVNLLEGGNTIDVDKCIGWRLLHAYIARCWSFFERCPGDYPVLLEKSMEQWSKEPNSRLGFLTYDSLGNAYELLLIAVALSKDSRLDLDKRVAVASDVAAWHEQYYDTHGIEDCKRVLPNFRRRECVCRSEFLAALGVECAEAFIKQGSSTTSFGEKIFLNLCALDYKWKFGCSERVEDTHELLGEVACHLCEMRYSEPQTLYLRELIGRIGEGMHRSGQNIDGALQKILKQLSIPRPPLTEDMQS